MAGYAQSALGITLGILLVVGLATRLVGVLQGLLLIVYIGGISSVWARGLSIDCGCFGGGGPSALGHTQYPADILRDIGLLALAVIVAARAPGRFAADRLPGIRPRHPGDAPDESHAAQPVEAEQHRRRRTAGQPSGLSTPASWS